MRDIEASRLWTAEYNSRKMEVYQPSFGLFCFQTDMAKLRSLMALQQFMRSLGENVDDEELV